MSDKLPFMPFYVSDYLADTTHLTTEEHGAYILLLFGVWKSGGQLPCDDVALSRIARLHLPRWKKIRGNVIPFFRVSGAVLTHKRVSAEIEKSRAVAKARSDAGQKGVEAKRLKNNGPPQANARRLNKQNTSKGEASHSSQESIKQAAQLGYSARETPPAPEDRRAACVAIGQRITDFMGVTNDPRWMGNWSIVQVWLAKGFDPELDIMPTVMAVVDRLRRGNHPMPASLKYFSAAIEGNHEARVKTGESQAQRDTREFFIAKNGSPEFKAWVAYWKSQGRKTDFYEKQEIITVPSQWPPKEGVVP